MPTVMLRSLFELPALEDFPGPFAHRARQVARELRRLWERTSREVAIARKVPELHATRDEYEALLKGHLRLLEEYLALAELHDHILGPTRARIDELRGAVRDLRQHYDELFPRWQTLEDLYSILNEKLSPSAEKLKSLAAQHPPPRSWYEETDDPFSSA